MQADLIRQIANDVSAELPDCRETVERFVLDWRKRYGGMRFYLGKKEAPECRESAQPRRSSSAGEGPRFDAAALRQAWGDP